MWLACQALIIWLIVLQLKRSVHRNSFEQKHKLRQCVYSNMSNLTPAPSAATGAVPAERTVARLMREHKHRQETLKRDSADALHAAYTEGTRATSDLLASSTHPAAVRAAQQEKVIDSDLRGLVAATDGLQRRMRQWGAHFAQMHAALKEVGDLANWSAAIESDMADAVAILDAVAAAKVAATTAGRQAATA
jgi:phage host-nuclease inhibitor protein Gam